MLVKRNIPIVIVFVTSLLFLINFFVTVPGIDTNSATTMVNNWGIILTAFSLGFGAINLFIFHGRHISRRTKGQWPLSLWLLIVIVLFTIVGVSTGVSSGQYTWLYNASYFALSATVYSSLGFYMTSGIYRALRAKNVESGLLLIVGVIALARNAPAVAAGFPIIIPWEAWLSAVPTTSAQRGIMIGAALGSLALGVRTMIGRETGFLGKLTEVERGG
jgi:lysylphosphatidylglycerol synthetase-like protein (DUF2156 family)